MEYDRSGKGKRNMVTDTNTITKGNIACYRISSIDGVRQRLEKRISSQGGYQEYLVHLEVLVMGKWEYIPLIQKDVVLQKD